MATTKVDIDRIQNAEQQVQEEGDAKNIDRKEESEISDFDKEPNQVSNGTPGTPREQGIARVGNTSPDEEETH